MLVKELEETFNGVIWIMADGLAQKSSETTKYDGRVIRRIDVEKEEPNSLNVWLEDEHELEEKEKRDEALEILCGMITIDSRKIGDDLFCVIINGVSKLTKKELELIKEVKG